MVVLELVLVAVAVTASAVGVGVVVAMALLGSVALVRWRGALVLVSGLCDGVVLPSGILAGVYVCVRVHVDT